MRRQIFILVCLLIAVGGSFACAGRDMTPASVSAVVAPGTSTAAEGPIGKALSAIEKAPDDPAGYTKLASLYIKSARESGDFGLNTKAEASIEKALQIDPNDISARKLKSSLDLTFHRFSEALESGLRLQKDFPADSFVYGVLTDANAELGNYDEAVAAAQKMVDLKPNTASYSRVAHLRSLYGKTDGAIEQFKNAARVADPLEKEAQSWCLVQLGDELWKVGKYTDAEKVYDEALENFPNYYLALAGKGRARSSQGDLETAKNILTDANNRIPNVETTILLGDIYSKMGNIEGADQQYALVQIIEQKIGINSDQKRLAMMWADHGTKLDEALDIATREYAVRKDILTADTLAWCLFKTGKLDEAKTVIADAMKLTTKDARMLYHAGIIEKGLGNRAEAASFITAALKLNPAFDLLQTDVAQQTLSEIRQG